MSKHVFLFLSLIVLSQNVAIGNEQPGVQTTAKLETQVKVQMG